MLGFGVALTGFGFSAYLTYREIFTIKAICEWCVSSAILMTILVILTGIRFLRADVELSPAQTTTESQRGRVATRAKLRRACGGSQAPEVPAFTSW